MTLIIETKGFTKTFGSNGVAVHALRGIDFSVGRGEFLSLIGPSGSGKSTLMAILGCLDTPTSGSYEFDGERVDGLSGYGLSAHARVILEDGDRRIFQRACEALPVPASEAVMVGDTPQTDVQGARQAGLRAVWLNRDHRNWPGNLARPDAVIGDLGQLLRCLRRLDP